jgi:hypothetical protein
MKGSKETNKEEGREDARRNEQRINPLTPELNPSAQRCLPRFFTGDFNF